MLGAASAAAPIPSAAADPPPARPIPDWFGRGLVPGFVGGPHTPDPPAGTPPPQHPFMADSGANLMHGDSYESGTHAASGPLGIDPEVRSSAFAPIGGLCAAISFDSQGRIVTVCGSFKNFTLRLLDPVSLGQYAARTLPQRPSTLQALLTLDLSKIFTDTSGGAYFYLDHLDRAVLVDADQNLRVIRVDESGPAPVFVDDLVLPLAGHLAERDCFSFPDNLFPSGRCDAVTTVMPDWDGTYWWVSRLGIVGTVDPTSGEVQTIDLGEEIQNSVATAPDGVYILSDHAMYGFRRDAGGAPEIAWRETYERAVAPRPGQINLGSGTSPTLIGDDLVAIADGADPINVVFMNRDPNFGGERTLCTEPVFAAGRSATDNSLIGYGNSVVVENNYGYADFLTVVFGRTVTGGLAKVDLVDDGGGAFHCETAWTSSERSPSTVPKLSRGNGLVYIDTKAAGPGIVDAWYFTAIDWDTGDTVYKVLTGTGWNFDNLWAPMTVGPDGTGYAGVFNGLVSVTDQP
ncbi:MAG: hypothetical protein IT198_04605 [Acidimicrobiia bacterium]|nr:hypothetical protein [Acidimicrobiia bacterium]